MANLLVSDAIDGLQRAYPNITDAMALPLFKEVYIEVLALCQVEEGTESKNLTDGTREYELSYDPQILKVRAVYYIESSSSARKLTPVSSDWMDDNIDQWRTTTQTGTPERFYIDHPTSASLSTQGKSVIGLDPIPDTTTSAGYPIITIYGPEYEEPSATTDIPMAFPNVRVFIEGMKRNWAMDRDPKMYPTFKQTFEDELTKAQNFINSQIEDLDSPKFAPAWMKNTAVQ